MFRNYAGRVRVCIAEQRGAFGIFGGPEKHIQRIFIPAVAQVRNPDCIVRIVLVQGVGKAVDESLQPSNRLAVLSQFDHRLAGHDVSSGGTLGDIAAIQNAVEILERGAVVPFAECCNSRLENRLGAFALHNPPVLCVRARDEQNIYGKQEKR
jgi:hypothetical protein